MRGCSKHVSAAMNKHTNRATTELIFSVRSVPRQGDLKPGMTVLLRASSNLAKIVNLIFV
jgi:hypothetical protein